MKINNINVSDEEMFLMIKISNYYYNDDLNQSKIAEIVGINRVQVNKLLKKAKQIGIVKINIINKLEESKDISSQIKEKSKLNEVIISPYIGLSQKENIQAIGEKAASYIANLIRDEKLIGLGWGTSIYDMVMSLNPDMPCHFTAVPLIGGVGETNPILSMNTMVRVFAEKFKANWIPLDIPFIVEDKKIKDSLFANPIVKRVIDAWNKLDMAIVGISSDIEHSPLLKNGFLGKEQLISLEKRGYVGGILNHFFDNSGNICLPEIENKLINISLEQIKKTNKVIAIAGGVEKVNSIITAIKSGFINILITDSETGLILSRLL